MAKFIVHYGGREFLTNDGSLLDDLSSDLVGVVKFRLEDGRFLTVATGPGIPIAVEEAKTPAVPRRIR